MPDGANTTSSSAKNSSRRTHLPCSIAIACLISLVFYNVASAYPVGSALSLKELADKSDFICKAIAVASKPVDDPWFEKHVGFAPHATELKIISVFKGPNLKTASFHHYVMEDSDVMYSPQHYEFEAGRTYLVFASKADEETMFRQIRKDHTIQRDQGVLLAADDAPHADKSIKEVYWLELTGLLKSQKLSDVRYAIDHLDWMSGGVRLAEPNEFAREDVVKAVRQTDPKVFQQAMNDLGRQFDPDPADPKANGGEAPASKSATFTLPPQDAPIQPPPEPREIKVFSLANGDAAESAKLLENLFPSARLSADARTNSIIVVANEKMLMEIEAILNRLDEFKSNAKSGGPAVVVNKKGALLIDKLPKPQMDLDVIERNSQLVVTQANVLRMSIADQSIIDVTQFTPKEYSIIGLGRGTTTLTLWLEGEPDPLICKVRVISDPDSSSPDKLPIAIAEHEEKARRLAEQIRKQSETLGPKHPDRVRNHEELDKTLSAALELKFQLEQRQLKQLEDRLSRMQTQFEFRRAANRKIVERRMQEMLEGFPLDWNAGGAPVTPGSSANGGGASNASAAKAESKHVHVELFYVHNDFQDEETVERFFRLLNAIPGLTTQSRERSQGDAVVLVIRRAAGQPVPRESGLTPEEAALKIRIEEALNSCGIKNFHWSEDSIPRDSKTARTDANATANDPSEITTQIQFVAPLGMRLLIEHDKTQLTIPARYKFERAEQGPKRHSVWLFPAGTPNELKIQLILEIFPANDRVKKFLAKDSVPLRITDEDLEQLRARKPVMKVVYLPNHGSQEPFETMVSTRLDPRIDPVTEAQRRGEIVAVFRFSGDPLAMGTVQAEEWLGRLMPLEDRLKSAKNKVRETEAVYYNDRSRAAAELQEAWNELQTARSLKRAEWKQFEQAVKMPIEFRMAFSESVAKTSQSVYFAQKEMFEAGRLSQEEFKAATDALQRATAENDDVKLAVAKYSEMFEKISSIVPQPMNESEGSTFMSFDAARSTGRPTYPVETATIWLEAAIEAKFDLIRFDDVKVWFPAALRVRESTRMFQAGDLIVLLNKHAFQNLDQAVDALVRNPGSSVEDSIVLRGGLSGEREPVHIWSVERKFLKPDPQEHFQVDLEIRVRKPGKDEIEARYLRGTVVSLDGLIAIPIAPKSIARDEPIVVFRPHKGTAHVVGSDDKHELTLIKLDCPGQKLFSWIKCREGAPARGQELGGSDWSTAGKAQVLDVAPEAIALRTQLPDAFTISHSASLLMVGTALTTVNKELQGIIVGESKPIAQWTAKDSQLITPPANTAEQARVEQGAIPPHLIALPAVYIEKLIREFRDSSKAATGEAAASQDSPKASEPTPAERSNDAKDDRDSLANRVRKELGVWFGPTVDPKLLPKSIRGGLLVTEASAVAQGYEPPLQKGDVLVGLHTWQTPSLESVLFALQDEARLETSNSDMFRHTMVYFVRNRKVHCGQMVFYRQTPAKTRRVPDPNASPMTLGVLIEVLEASRDREIIAKLSPIVAALGTGPDFGRAASAILASVEFIGPNDDAKVLEIRNEILQSLNMYTMSKAEVAGSILQALREGHPQVKLFAAKWMSDLKDFTLAPEFPELAEQLFKLGEAQDFEIRSAALALLTRTVQFTKLDPAELSTEERRTMVKRLAEYVPRKRVVQLLLATLNNPQINIAQLGASQLLTLPDEPKGPDIRANLVRVLGSIAKGKLGDAEASRGQSMLALGELGGLMNILGNDAKEILPEVKAALAAYDKTAKEDALFLKNAGGESTALTTLRKYVRALDHQTNSALPSVAP